MIQSHIELPDDALLLTMTIIKVHNYNTLCLIPTVSETLTDNNLPYIWINAEEDMWVAFITSNMMSQNKTKQSVIQILSMTVYCFIVKWCMMIEKARGLKLIGIKYLFKFFKILKSLYNELLNQLLQENCKILCRRLDNFIIFNTPSTLNEI